MKIIIYFSFTYLFIFNIAQQFVPEIIMFLFKQCCQSYDSGVGYQVKTHNEKNEEVVTFVTNLDDIKHSDLTNRRNRILRIEKSAYDQLINKYKGTDKQWTDPQFPPEDRSIGAIENVNTPRWKRISQILTKNPVLFDGKVEPHDVIQGNLGDCYFLSALASLAEKQNRIKTCFGDQTFNSNGIYKVTLRIDGVIQEIVIDDYIPVNSEGEPLFCQPNKNQFWVLILEKAWAKAHGSYANIVAGSPTQVFKAVTYAPAEVLIIKENEEQRDKLWRRIVDHAKKDHPCCCGTSDSASIDWTGAGLVPGHAYTLIDAQSFTDKDGRHHRMMKIRNPWGQREWEGEGNEKDKTFWNNIEQTTQKEKFLGRMVTNNDGVFYMTYEDFCKYFTQTHFCMMEDQGNYVSENLYTNGKNGSIYKVKVFEKSYYTFELHQSGIRGEELQKEEDGLSRGTIIIAEENMNGCRFVDGALNYHEEDVTLRVYLEPGDYLFYTKLDPSRKRRLLPERSSVSIYSQDFVHLSPSKQELHPGFLKKAFLSHARSNKRQSYNNDLMWIAWKLLYQQGGYAYIALGNDRQSDKKFVVTFNESDFDKMNFKLKKTYKSKGDEQRLEIMPGQEEIILARVKNMETKSMKFPPPLGLKMESII